MELADHRKGEKMNKSEIIGKLIYRAERRQAMANEQVQRFQKEGGEKNVDERIYERVSQSVCSSGK